MNLSERIEMLSDYPMYCAWVHLDGDSVQLDGTFNLAQLELLVSHIKEHGYKETEQC